MATLRFNLSSRRSLRKRPAFSLAELMIALVILGLGLLFIAAALPVGVDYTRRTLDLAAAEAAGDEAIQAIQLGVRTAQRAVNAAPGGPAGVTRLDSLVRPRTNDVVKLFPADPDIEPVLKVRPLIGNNVDLTPGTSRMLEATDLGEEFLVAAFGPRLQTRYGQSATAPQSVMWQLDRPTGNNAFAFSDVSVGGVLPSAMRVYPAISPDTPFNVDAFLTAPYTARRVTSRATPAGVGNSELTKLSNARLVWTALYRRVAYNHKDPAGAVHPSDADLYEFIVFVLRRPTPQHRFARQNPQAVTGDPLARPAALVGTSVSGTADRLMPEPWLVSFESIPARPTTDWIQGAAPTFDRQLQPGFNHPTELFFTCSEALGKLLPVGSYIVPALNDDFTGNPVTAGQPPTPTLQPAARHAGFVPHAPDTLPIYEVVKRPDSRTVVVKGNGFYPWVGGGAGPGDWLCWVIPPPFTERVGNEPVYDQRSQILTVVRRTIRVPEMP